MGQGRGTVQHPTLPPGGQSPGQALPLVHATFPAGLQCWQWALGPQGQQCPPATNVMSQIAHYSSQVHNFDDGKAESSSCFLKFLIILFVNFQACKLQEQSLCWFVQPLDGKLMNVLCHRQQIFLSDQLFLISLAVF